MKTQLCRINKWSFSISRFFYLNYRCTYDIILKRVLTFSFEPHTAENGVTLACCKYYRYPIVNVDDAPVL